MSSGFSIRYGVANPVLSPAGLQIQQNAQNTVANPAKPAQGGRRTRRPFIGAEYPAEHAQRGRRTRRPFIGAENWLLRFYLFYNTLNSAAL